MQDLSEKIDNKETLKVAVFGTSRSGKDYTIYDASELLSHKGLLFNHISPIKLVHEKLNGRKLSEMQYVEKRWLMDDVRQQIGFALYDGNVFVDEHYSFPESYNGRVITNGYYGEKLPSYKVEGPEERIYDVIFREEWIDSYDLVVYLEIDPDVILERFRSSEGDKYNPFITSMDIRLWQLFELENIQRICGEHDIPLYYVYDHTRSGEELKMIVSHHLRAHRNFNNQKQS